jgi:hypothetical protein
MRGDEMLSGEVKDKISIDDSWEAVNEYYFEQGWTDGLPIVPPTEERVAAMMECTGWDPQEVVAVLEPKKGVATIEKIAVNAVMAGCLPQYMPVLIAAVQGIGKEVFNLYGVQTSTHNTSVLAIVNGPIAKELDINCGYNVTGNRWRSTAAIGRAIGFIPGAHRTVPALHRGKRGRKPVGTPACRTGVCPRHQHDHCVWRLHRADDR